MATFKFTGGVHKFQDKLIQGVLDNGYTREPMGFYAPAQLVRDAREHGVKVRPVDINLSDWDCTLNRRAGVITPCVLASSWCAA
jgi:hypothetical protein